MVGRTAARALVDDGRRPHLSSDAIAIVGWPPERTEPTPTCRSHSEGSHRARRHRRGRQQCGHRGRRGRGMREVETGRMTLVWEDASKVHVFFLETEKCMSNTSAIKLVWILCLLQTKSSTQICRQTLLNASIYIF